MGQRSFIKGTCDGFLPYYYKFFYVPIIVNLYQSNYLKKITNKYIIYYSVSPISFMVNKRGQTDYYLFLAISHSSSWPIILLNQIKKAKTPNQKFFRNNKFYKNFNTY